jgi:hypothetical protein
MAHSWAVRQHRVEMATKQVGRGDGIDGRLTFAADIWAAGSEYLKITA